MTIRRVSLIGLALVVLLAACASKPPAAPQPEPETQVTEPAPQPEPVPEAPKEPEISRDELEALHGRVIALRKDAFDLGLKDLLAKEYTEADGAYVKGKSALDADERPAAKTELGKAETLFTELVARGGTMVAQGRKSDADSARQRALDAGAETLSAGALAEAESALAAADALLAAGDLKGAIAAYTLSIAAFDAVEKRSSAVAVKTRVDELDYGPYDAGNYELAGQRLADVDRLLAKDPKAAQDAAQEALLRYRLVLARGWELAAGVKRDAAEKYKIYAEGIKAQVAVKDQYAEAKSVWDEAVAIYESGNHEGAVPTFELAEELFAEVYELAATKREAAEAAIRAAKSRTATSESIALEGDKALGKRDATKGED